LPQARRNRFQLAAAGTGLLEKQGDRRNTSDLVVAGGIEKKTGSRNKARLRLPVNRKPDFT
jgi:hypothetical protein